MALETASSPHPRPGRPGARDRRSSQLLRVHEGQPVREPVRARGRLRQRQQPEAALAGPDRRRRGRARSRRSSRSRTATAPPRVTMEIEDKALPLHEDAELKIRPRIFLEGNFFVDLQPGSPTAPELDDGGTIPMTQTAAPVQFGDLLAALQSRHAQGPPDLPAGVLEGARGRRRRGLQRVDQVLGARLPQLGDRERGVARPAARQGHPAHPRGQAKVRARSCATRTRCRTWSRTSTPSPARSRARTTRSRRRCRAARHAAGRPARRSSRSTTRCRRCARSRATRCRASAPPTRRSRRRARSSPSCARSSCPAELRGTAARAARADPQPRRLQPRLAAAARRGPPAVGVHEQRARPVRRVAHPGPASPPTRTIESSSRCSTRSRTSRARAACTTATTRPSTPVPCRPAPNVRPAPPTDGGFTPPPHRPDLPCEIQELPNLDAPGGPSLSFPALEHSPGSRRQAARSHARRSRASSTLPRTS